MRIIRGNHKGEAIKLIACEMINIEYNKMVYVGTQIQSYPWKEYISGTLHDVHFDVQSSMGYIAMSYGDISRESLVKATDALDNQLRDYPSKLVVTCSRDLSNNTGFTQKSEYKRWTKPRMITNVYDKKIADQHKYNDTTLYFWFMYSFNDIVLLRDHMPPDILTTFDTFNRLLRAATCIVYDPNRKFSFEDNHLELNFPLVKDLTCFPNYLDLCVNIHIIYGIRWHIYNARSSNNSDCYELNCPVYDELYENVNLIKFDHGEYKPSMGRHKSHMKLHIKYIYECSLEEAIMSASKNDVCNACLTLLYDEIYVVEVLTPTTKNQIILTHIGLCAICVHSCDVLSAFSELAVKTTLLKVTYPRSFEQVLALLNYSEKNKRIMNSIHTTKLYYDSTVMHFDNTFDSIISVKSPYDLYAQDSTKYTSIFTYKLISQESPDRYYKG